MKQIIVIKERWVMVGTVEETETTITLTAAQNIRRWGTTKGLGQLAQHGPTRETILDNYGTVVIEKHAALIRINCKGEDPWPSK